VDQSELKTKILQIKANGGTDLSAGFIHASNMIEKGMDKFPQNSTGKHIENRIILLTDMNPTSGETSSNGLFGLAEATAKKGIYSTFIGVGLDFNTDLVEHITTNIRGANYLSVKSSREFKKQMDEDFDYLVTSLVFNVKVHLEAKGFHIDRVYGSPESNTLNGDLMKIGTLFPSAKEKDGQTKGGVVLIKLRRDQSTTDNELTLKIQFEDFEGRVNNTEVELEVEKHDANFFQNSGIRKAILLTQYVNLIKNFLVGVKIDFSTGILPPPTDVNTLKWELEISDDWKKIFGLFKDYLESEIESIGDSSLEKELKVVDEMINNKKENPRQEQKVDKVAELILMGFERQKAIDALQKSGDDVQQAANFLLGQ